MQLSLSPEYPHFDSAHFDSTHFYVMAELTFILVSAINGTTYVMMLVSICKLIIMIAAKMIAKAREAVLGDV
jgi:hypothetical protein